MPRELCALLVWCSLSSACGGTSTAVSAPSVDRLDPRVLYPMLANSQWVYDVDTGGGEPPTLGIYEVVDVNDGRHSVANNRGMDAQGNVRYSEPVVYEVTESGIRHAASGGYLLRAPIEEDGEWPSMGGRTARVTDIDHAVEVVAGSFEHCVEVTEGGGEDGRTIRTVYCPEVGPVEIESSLTTEMTMRHVGTTARLRNYDNGTDG